MKEQGQGKVCTSLDACVSIMCDVHIRKGKVFDAEALNETIGNRRVLRLLLNNYNKDAKNFCPHATH